MLEKTNESIQFVKLAFLYTVAVFYTLNAANILYNRCLYDAYFSVYINLVQNVAVICAYLLSF